MNRRLPPRTEYDSGKVWFVVIDLSDRLRAATGGIRPGVAAWLRANLPEDAISVRRVVKTDERRSGLLICVEAEFAKVVATYATHLSKGGNFRAKWAELPDYPSYDTPMARAEVAWRNLYKWSRAQHQVPGGVNNKLLSEMRGVRIDYELNLGRAPTGSWEQTKAELEAHWAAARQAA